jgi:hypothetical protein
LNIIGATRDTRTVALNDRGALPPIFLDTDLG